MQKRCVLITGGANGIGYGIAEYLASKQHTVIIADINEQAASEACNRLKKSGFDAHWVDIDVTDPTAIAALPDRVAPLHVDVLINNAGIQHVSKLEDFPAEKWQLLVNVMLVGPALLTQAFLPAMRKNDFGRIINVGSIHSLVASPYKSAYVAAKHGLIGFAKTMALETSDCNVTVNTLCPAYVKTQLVEKQIAAQAKENGITEEEVVNNIMLEPMPKKSFIETEELAVSAEFLMSDAAKNITAQTLALDGGWTAR